jgi:hypothetical protein
MVDSYSLKIVRLKVMNIGHFKTSLEPAIRLILFVTSLQGSRLTTFLEAISSIPETMRVVQCVLNKVFKSHSRYAPAGELNLVLDNFSMDKGRVRSTSPIQKFRFILNIAFFLKVT